jgi:hypothetical protein
MTLQRIPTGEGPQADPLFDQTTPLDGTSYKLYFAYNQRAACWYLSIATLDGEPVTTVKLLCQWDLLLTCVSPLRPPGKLLVISATTDKSPPGLTDLLPGARCALVYITQTDVAALTAIGAANLAAGA